MKHASTCALIAALLMSGAAVAQQLQQRPLAAISLTAEDGNVITTNELRRNGNWVLLVVDADLPSTGSLLDSLVLKDESFDERTVVLVVGPASALTQLVESHPRLTGVRWYRTNDSAVIEQLRLPGLPAMLGITSAHAVAWQRTGVRQAGRTAANIVKSWITLTTPP